MLMLALEVLAPVLALVQEVLVLAPVLALVQEVLALVQEVLVLALEVLVLVLEVLVLALVQEVLVLALEVLVLVLAASALGALGMRSYHAPMQFKYAVSTHAPWLWQCSIRASGVERGVWATLYSGPHSFLHTHTCTQIATKYPAPS